MNNKQALEKIQELQEEYRTLKAQSYRKLEEADKLINSFKDKNRITDRFICDGYPWVFIYKGYETKPGNRYWLSIDSNINVLD